MKQSKKTAEELIKIIKDNELLAILFQENFDFHEVYFEGLLVEDVEKHVKETLGLGEIEGLDYRYDTDEFWIVLYFKDHDVYLKIDGEYDSYGQGEHAYEDIYEVKPKEVTKIIYE